MALWRYRRIRPVVLNLFSKRPKLIEKIKCVKFCDPLLFCLGWQCFWDRKNRGTPKFSWKQFAEGKVKNKKEKTAVRSDSCITHFYVSRVLRWRSKKSLHLGSAQVPADLVSHYCFLQISLFVVVYKKKTNDPKNFQSTQLWVASHWLRTTGLDNR